MWFNRIFNKRVSYKYGFKKKGFTYLYAIKSYFDKRIFSKVFKPCISLINLLSEVWLPSTIFPGSRELVITSPTLCRSHSSPAILCMHIWYCIISRHRSSIVVLAWFLMIYVFGRFYKDDLYYMHELSLKLGFMWNVILWMWFDIKKKIMLLEMDFIWKCFIMF